MRARSKRIHNLVAVYWQPAVFYGTLLLFFGALLWFKLGSLTSGYGADETAAMQASSSMHQILNNPIDAPFKLLAYVLMAIGNHDILFVRLAATAFGLLTLTTFFWLVRYWHGERSAVFGTILFGCSAWFLHTARQGTPEVLLFLLLALVACAMWIKRTDNPLVLLVGFVLVTALLYVPGMIWLLAVTAIWQSKTIARWYKEYPTMMMSGTAGLVALTLPLWWSLYVNPSLAKVLAGLPQYGWPHLMASLDRLAHIPLYLFARGPAVPEHWLARLPVLDALTIAMLFLGAYLYARHFRLVRVKLVTAALAFGLVLASLGGAVTISAIIPFLYVLAAAGIGFMLDRWQTVFPRNVIAQSIGTVLISVAVLLSCMYGIRQYFVAWPNAPATSAAFTTHP